MKKAIMLLLLILPVISAGCSKDLNLDMSNTYVENQDYQYNFSDLSTGDMVIQKGNGGYYFAMNSFLYFLDENTMKASPLCDKANCLHDKEPDIEKQAECDAYLFDNGLNTDFFFANNKLYTLVDESYYEGEKLIVINSIYEAEPDGTGANKILTMRDQIMYWIVHRGSIYYISADDGNVKKYSLSDGSTELFFDLNSVELYSPDLYHITAYGNEIYLSVSGYKDEAEFNEMLNGADISPYEYIYVSNLEGERQRIISSKQSPNGIIFQGFIDDGMLYTDADYDKETKSLYLLHQDGKQEKLNYEFKNIFDIYFEDETFIYVKHGASIDNLEENIYDVFDKQGNLITTVDFTDGLANEFILGDEKYLFYLESNDQGEKLFYIDKNKLKNGQAEPQIIYSK